jgi:starvation-inducible outer membrane lipoprotein
MTKSPALRALALAGCLAIAACAATPGPIEMQARDASAACNAGHADACQQALMLTNMASLERDQRQRDAAAATQAGVSVGFLILGAILGAHH